MPRVVNVINSKVLYLKLRFQASSGNREAYFNNCTNLLAGHFINKKPHLVAWKGAFYIFAH